MNGRVNQLLLLLTLFGFLISACSAAQTTQPTADSVPVTEAALQPTSTELPPEPTATEVPTLVPTVTTEPTATPLPTEPPPSPTPEPTLGIGSTRVSEIDGMEQVYVPAGEFILGSEGPNAQYDKEGNTHAWPEQPEQLYYLDGFWIDKYEVTTGQWKLCVEAGACEPPRQWWSTSRQHYYDDPQFDNFPVIYITWYMASDYCAWTGRRLPTEVEWEKAARGPNGNEFPWGNEPYTDDRANICDIDCIKPHANPIFNDGYPDTAPVGSYPAGASYYGAMDMAGNVWEWTSTVLRDYPYDPNDGREDPTAPGERVWKGGPWSNGTWWIRSSLRYRSPATYFWGNLGFRCAASD